jgi:hypothetical protein
MEQIAAVFVPERSQSFSRAARNGKGTNAGAGTGTGAGTDLVESSVDARCYLVELHLLKDPPTSMEQVILTLQFQTEAEHQKWCASFVALVPSTALRRSLVNVVEEGRKATNSGETKTGLESYAVDKDPPDTSPLETSKSETTKVETKARRTSTLRQAKLPSIFNRSNSSPKTDINTSFGTNTKASSLGENGAVAGTAPGHRRVMRKIGSLTHRNQHHRFSLMSGLPSLNRSLRKGRLSAQISLYRWLCQFRDSSLVEYESEVQKRLAAQLLQNESIENLSGATSATNGSAASATSSVPILAGASASHWQVLIRQIFMRYSDNVCYLFFVVAFFQQPGTVYLVVSSSPCSVWVCYQVYICVDI